MAEESVMSNIVSLGGLISGGCWTGAAAGGLIGGASGTVGSSSTEDGAQARAASFVALVA